MCERVKYNQESFHCVSYFLSWQNDQGGGFFVKVSGVYRLAAIGIFSKKDSITGGIRFVKQKFNVSILATSIFQGCSCSLALAVGSHHKWLNERLISRMPESEGSFPIGWKSLVALASFGASTLQVKPWISLHEKNKKCIFIDTLTYWYGWELEIAKNTHRHRVHKLIFSPLGYRPSWETFSRPATNKLFWNWPLQQCARTYSLRGTNFEFWTNVATG